MLLSEFVGRVIQLNGGDREVDANLPLEAYVALRQPQKRKYVRRASPPAKTQPTDGGNAPAAAQKAPVVKRRRGRPRKSPLIDPIYLAPKPRSRVTATTLSSLPGIPQPEADPSLDPQT